jgi:PAS domain S-box-containing protein
MNSNVFESLFDSAPDAVVIVDEGGLVVLINSQAEKLFGYSKDELVGKAMEILMPQHFRAGHQKHRGDFAKDPRARAMGAGQNLFAKAKNGREFPVEISLSPLRTEKGLLVSSAIRDISDRKQLEEELHKKNQALLEQNERVELANRMKSQFLANMSHELRTPLNSIIGFTEIIHDGKAGSLNEAQKEYLGDVLTSSRHLLQLINDVLDLAKIESGKLRMQLAPVELPPLLLQSAAMLRIQTEKRRIQIHAHANPDLDGIISDQARLKQVLYNYLSNAIKFSHENGEVWIRAMAEGADEFRLEVEDKGIGIPIEDQALLFNEFEQLDAGTDKKYQGTGL